MKMRTKQTNGRSARRLTSPRSKSLTRGTRLSSRKSGLIQKRARQRVIRGQTRGKSSTKQPASSSSSVSVNDWSTDADYGRRRAQAKGWSPSYSEYRDADYRKQSRSEFDRPGYREGKESREESDYDRPDNVRSQLKKARQKDDREDFRRFENRSYNQPGREYESYDRAGSRRSPQAVRNKAAGPRKN